jgi:hypothetical protein
MSSLTAFNCFVRQCLLYPLTSPFLPPIDKVELGHSYAAGAKIGTLIVPPAYGLPKTGQTTEYTNYDDGHYKAGYPKTGNRFTDVGNGTILDNATGLIWIKDSTSAQCNNGNALDWESALTFCEGVDFAGQTDWRTPNAREMLSLIDYERSNPCIDPIFTNILISDYWTSTTLKNTTVRAYTVGYMGGSLSTDYKWNTKRIRPVRGG